MLDAPQAIQAFDATSPDAIQHTLAFLAEDYQFIVVDAPPGLSEDTCAVIRQSDRLAIIITPELPAIHNSYAQLSTNRITLPIESIDIVLNRYSRRRRWRIGKSNPRSAPIAVRIPNNYAQIVRAINAGMPIDRGHKSDLPTAFDSWADRLVGDERVPPLRLRRRVMVLRGSCLACSVASWG